MNEPRILKIEVPNLIPLRYYKGWVVAFDTTTETFQSDLLCLYGFSNSKDLEKAMDIKIAARG